MRSKLTHPKKGMVVLGMLLLAVTGDTCLSTPGALTDWKPASGPQTGATTVQRQIFTFWDELPLPEFIAVCVASFAAANPHWQVHLLTVANVQDYLLDPPPTQASDYDLDPQHIADWYRVQAVLRWGGVWIDASVISLGPVHSWVRLDHEELTGFYSPWTTDQYREERNVSKALREMDMENSIFAAPAGNPLVAQWRDNLAEALTMGFDAYVAAQPIEITGTHLEGQSYLSAYVALRQAMAQLNATIHVASGRRSNATDQNDVFEMITNPEVSSGVAAPPGNPGPDIRLLPALLNHGSYYFEDLGKSVKGQPVWSDCDALEEVFACKTVAGCADLLVDTPLVKLRGAARGCLDDKSLSDLRPGQVSYVRDLLVAGFQRCTDLRVLSPMKHRTRGTVALNSIGDAERATMLNETGRAQQRQGYQEPDQQHDQQPAQGPQQTRLQHRQWPLAP